MNNSFLIDCMKETIGITAKQIMAEYTDHERSKKGFIKATTNIEVANALVSLCLVAAANFSELRINEFIRKQRSNGDMTFIEALQSIEQNDLLYCNNGNWSVHILNFMGRCLMEAGYISDMGCVKEYYQDKIGAKSMFSPNYIAESELVQVRPIIAEKRKMSSQARVVEAVMDIIIHMNTLREQ